MGREEREEGLRKGAVGRGAKTGRKGQGGTGGGGSVVKDGQSAREGGGPGWDGGEGKG